MSDGTRRTVLIVDDNEIDRAWVRSALEERYELIEAVDAAEGIAACTEADPDLVLLDYRLPDQDGIEVLRDHRTEGCAVIVLTGAGDEEVAVTALKAGASDYLVKGGLDPETLRRAVAHAISTRELREKLERTDIRYRQLFESNVSGIFVATAGGELVDCNRAMATMLGFRSVAEAVEAGVDPLFEHPGERGALIEALKQQGSLPAFEQKLRAPDGSARYLLASAVGFFEDDDELREICGYAVDITDRKLAQAERDIMASAVRQAAEAIVITDPNGTIQLVNEAFERMSGYSSTEVIGRNPRLLKSGEQDESFYEGLWGTIMGGGIWSGRLVNQRKDGSHYHVDATISPLRGPDGEIVRFLSFQKDITREVDLERQLHASQRLEAVGQLAGGIAHDFNNLMTVVLSNAEMAASGLAEDDPNRAPLGEIENAVMSARALTRQLLAFGRRQVLHPRVVDPNQVVERIQSMMGRLLGDRIDLRVSFGSPVANVRTDPAQLESVVLNLALNARDAMPEGGTLTVSTSEVEVDEAYMDTHAGARPGRFVVLAVSDTGIGMDEETRARIFEPFFTTKRGGSGMGLAMVYGTVKQSGGNIWVYSDPGGGSTFKIYLPVVQEAVDQPVGEPAKALEPTPAAAGALPASSARILLVEDNDAVRRSISRILEASGYQVSAEADGAAALAALENGALEHDLLVTDMMMPGMTGFELVERASAFDPSLRVLFVSGYSSDVALRGRQLTVTHAFLEKPFTADELTRQVREMLGNT